MGNKGGRKHRKRITAPRIRNIPRKDLTWTIKGVAGAHKLEKSVPLTNIMRDILKIALNAREVKKVVKKGEVYVDNRKIKDPRLGIGFMDIISIPKMKKFYRTVLDKKGRITLQEIDEQAAKFKLCRIEGKTIIKKGNIQLNLHDGRCILTKDTVYSTGDVVKIGLPNQNIIEHYALKKGNTAYIIGGKHAGEISKIKEVIKGTMRRETHVSFEGELFTPLKYVFVIGKEEPAIKIL